MRTALSWCEEHEPLPLLDKAERHAERRIMTSDKGPAWTAADVGDGSVGRAMDAESSGRLAAACVKRSGARQAVARQWAVGG